MSIGCLLYVPQLGIEHNPVICPDQETNLQPFGVEDDAQPTEPPGQGRTPGFLTMFPMKSFSDAKPLIHSHLD